MKYTAASKQSALDNVSRALENMSSTFKRDTKLQSILTAPTLSTSDKKQIVAEIQKSTGVQDKTNTLTNFLNTLAENNRLAVLEGVCDKFAQLMSAARGEIEMTITSAQALDQKIVRQLEQAVSKSQYVGQGQKLKVVPKVRLPPTHEFDCMKMAMRCANVFRVTGQPRHPRRPDRRNRRPNHRPLRLRQDGTHEQAPPGYFVDM